MGRLEAGKYENPFENATSWTWFVRFVDIQDIWQLHSTNLCHELDFFGGALLTLIHALRTCGRFPYLWLTTILHGVTLESVTFILPDVDNFWHAQGTVTLLGGRFPLHILMLFGVCVVLMDMPYDIMGIKLLWWTWHDTDPNIYDRNYYVPWNSYYFHATFAASLTLMNCLLRKVIVRKHPRDPQSGSMPLEVLVCILSSWLGFSGGVLLFIPLYHPMHDVLGVHTECIVVALLLSFTLIAWSADRNASLDVKSSQSQKAKKPWILVFLVACHYTIYVSLAIFAQPEKSVVVGLHELTGPCNETISIRTPFGQILKRRKYLCTTDYDEPYDFHCTENGTAPYSSTGSHYYWYTICGTAYANHAEYIFVVCCVCAFASFVYLQLLLRSSSDIFAPAVPVKHLQKIKRN